MFTTGFVFIFGLSSLIFSNALADEYYIRGLLIGLVVAALFIRSLCARFRGATLPPNREQKSWLFYAILALMLVIAGAGYSRAVYFSGYLDGLFSMHLMVGVYILARRHAFNPEYVLRTACIVGLVQIVIAHLQFYGLSAGIPWVIPVETTKAYHVVGNIGYRGMLAIFVAICIMNGAYLIAKAKSVTMRVVYSLMTTLLLAGLLSVGGRAAILALLFAVVPWIVFGLKNLPRFSLSRSRKLILSLSLLLVFCVLAVAGKDSAVVQSMRRIGTDVSSSLRLSHYATTLTMIRDHPLVGVGLGNYKFRYLEAQRRMKTESVFPEKYSRFIGKLPWTYSLWAHNEYLHFAAEFGLVLLFSLLAVAFFWLRNVFWRMRAFAPSCELIWGLSILVLFAITSLFERPFHHIDIMVWFALSCAVINKDVFGNAAVEPERVRKPKTAKKAPPRSLLRTAGQLCLLAMIAAGTVLYVHGAYGQYHIRQAYDAMPRGETPPSYEATYEHLKSAEAAVLARDEVLRFRSYIDVPYYSSLHVARPSREHLRATWDAINRLYEYFTSHPTAENFFYLQKVAITYNREDIFRRVIAYLPEKPVM